MAAKKPCIRCSRSIDEWARICPFCNTDQVSPQTIDSYESSYTSAAPKPTRSRGDFFRSVPGRILIGVGIVLLLGGTFAVGTIVYSIGKTPPPTRESQRAEVQPGQPTGVGTDAVPGGLTLVPGGAAQTSFGQQSPVAPEPEDQPANDALRTDATALSAEVYARMAQAERQRQAREQQERAAQPQDPREVEGTPAWAAGQQAPSTPPPPPQTETAAPPEEAAAARRAEAARAAAERERQERQRAEREREQQAQEEQTAARRTAPVPTSQPLPDITDIETGGTVRLNLTVDASGRVREVEIVQGVPGITARLIESVRRWRFRPATENGRPVQGVFPVEVSFNASN